MNTSTRSIFILVTFFYLVQSYLYCQIIKMKIPYCTPINTHFLFSIYSNFQNLFIFYILVTYFQGNLLWMLDQTIRKR